MNVENTLRDILGRLERLEARQQSLLILPSSPKSLKIQIGATHL